MFADDIVNCGEGQKHVKGNLDEVCLRGKRDKGQQKQDRIVCVWMIVRRGTKVKLEEFKHPGSTIDNSGQRKKQRWRRISADGDDCQQEGVITSVIYGSETLALSGKQQAEQKVTMKRCQDFQWKWPGWTGLEINRSEEQLRSVIWTSS